MKKKEIVVAFVITKLELGGAQKVCLSLWQELKKQGVTTYLISGTSGILATKVQNNDSVFLLPSFKRELSWRMILNEIKTFIALATTLRQLKKKHPELIVHTHSTKAGIMGRWAALFAGVKNRLHTIHGYALHDYQSLVAWLGVYLCEWVTSLITAHFIAVSSRDVKKGIQLFPSFSKRHTIIRAAVPTHMFKPATPTSLLPPPPGQPFIFGAVACFKPPKNLEDLIDAFAFVHKNNPRTRLEIIGDGTLRAKLEERIKHHKLQKAVKLHGWIAPEELPAFMKNWHAFCLSSLWEGLPCAIIEARLMKLPVISYATGGIPDVIISEQNGLLYKPKDKDGLAQGMLSLLHDQTLYLKLSSYQDNLEEFTIDAMVQQHHELYQQCVECRLNS